MGFPSPVGEAVPAIQVPSAQENPSSDRERHRAQDSGPGFDIVIFLEACFEEIILNERYLWPCYL